jgi:Family of unknown function (DUF5819)
MVKIYSRVVLILLIIHFCLIILTQCYDQGWGFIKFKFIEKINYSYVNPYFEQSWSMFSPNPPKGNEYICLKFYSKTCSSKMINIHQKIMENSFKKPFSLDQRTIKYLNECYSDLLINKNLRYSNNELIEKSHGIQSIMNYSKIVLMKQKDFLKRTNENDSIKIDIYLVQEPLNVFENSKLKREQFYVEVENLFLTTKKKLENE